MPSVARNGMVVEYLDEGAGPNVVLLHSSVSGNRQWRPVMRCRPRCWRSPGSAGNCTSDCAAWPTTSVPSPPGDCVGVAVAAGDLRRERAGDHAEDGRTQADDLRG